MDELLLILGMMTVTWGVRVAPFLLHRLDLSASMLRFLNCVPPAVLAALIAEPIFQPVAQAGNPFQPEMMAAVICLVLGLLRAPMLLVVIVGMFSFWLLRAMMGV